MFFRGSDGADHHTGLTTTPGQKYSNSLRYAMHRFQYSTAAAMQGTDVNTPTAAARQGTDINTPTAAAMQRTDTAAAMRCTDVNTPTAAACNAQMSMLQPPPLCNAQISILNRRCYAMHRCQDTTMVWPSPIRTIMCVPGWQTTLGGRQPSNDSKKHRPNQKPRGGQT